MRKVRIVNLMKCILTRIISIYLKQTKFQPIKRVQTPSTMSVDLKRSSDFVERSDEKRPRTGESPTNHTELDIANDYRNFRIKEETVGITQFVSNNKGFKCDIKQRFSDFIVHEIGTDGEIVELSSQEPPEIDFEDDDFLINDEVLIQLIPDELRARLDELDQGPDSTEYILIDVNDKDKNQRTKVHKFLSRYSTLESLTEMIDEKRHVKVIKKPKINSRRINTKWPKSLPIYLHFSFYQENKGTTDALGDLAKKLRINVKNIGYAGLKDKRAISTQQCSLYKILPSKLIEFNRRAAEYKFPSATGNFRFKDVPLFLGDAIGNKFQIVLRDVEYEHEDDLSESIENVKQNGFINYFGIQRFGHSEYPSHQVGIAIVKKQCKEAIDTILRYRQKDIEPAPFAKQKKTFNECLKIYREDNDAKTAFKEFYWKASNEGHLLRGLSLYGTNYLQAFSEIPRNNRSFYCHSFQSFVWNRIASYRFRTYGLKLIKGDLVIRRQDLFNSKPAEPLNGKATNACDQETLKEDAKHNDRVKLNYIREFDDEDVVVVDETNIDDYTIFDVVLPLIGPKVQNPENSVKDEIKRILDELEIGEDYLESVGDMFFMKGSYRRFMAKPIDLKYEIVKYEDNTVRLFESDLDKLNNVKHKVENAGTKTAILLEFCLSSSSYATVLIRELSRQNC